MTAQQTRLRQTSLTEFKGPTGDGPATRLRARGGAGEQPPADREEEKQHQREGRPKKGRAEEAVWQAGASGLNFLEHGAEGGWAFDDNRRELKAARPKGTGGNKARGRRQSPERQASEGEGRGRDTFPLAGAFNAQSRPQGAQGPARDSPRWSLPQSPDTGELSRHFQRMQLQSLPRLEAAARIRELHAALTPVPEEASQTSAAATLQRPRRAASSAASNEARGMSPGRLRSVARRLSSEETDRRRLRLDEASSDDALPQFGQPQRQTLKDYLRAEEEEALGPGGMLAWEL